MKFRPTTACQRLLARAVTLAGAGLVALTLSAGPAQALTVSSQPVPTRTSSPCLSLPEYCHPDAVDDFCIAQLKSTGILFGACRNLSVQW